MSTRRLPARTDADHIRRKTTDLLPPFEIQDGVLRWLLHPGQIRIMASESKYIFATAGTQSGKTSVAPLWLWREIQRRGEGDYLAVSANFDLFQMKLLPSMKAYIVDLLKRGRYWSSNRTIEIRDPDTGEFWAKRADDPMWARIILRSAQAGRGDTGVAGLESATAKAALLDEAGLDDYTLPTWEAVLRRLSLNEGRVLGTTTLYNFGYLKTEIYDRWAAGDADYEIVQFDSMMNPTFPRAEYEAAKRRMPSWRFDMMYRGIFTRPAGAILGDFTDDHIVDAFEVPDIWKQVVGIDPGPVHTAVLWLAEHPVTGLWYVHHESLEGWKTSAEHAAGVKAYGERFPRSPKRYILGTKSEHQYRIDWAHYGVPVQDPPIGEVEAGIDRIVGLLKTDRLRVFRTCTRTIAQIRAYSRELDRQTKEPTDKIKDKGSYHMVDALRYAVTGIPLASGPGPRRRDERHETDQTYAGPRIPGLNLSKKPPMKI